MGFAVFLIPFVDILYLFFDFRKAWRAILMGYLFLFFGILFLGSHSYIKHFYNLSDDSSLNSVNHSKLLPKNLPKVCSEFAVTGIACDMINSKVKDPYLRDSFVVFNASDCGDSLKLFLKDSPSTARDIKEFIEKLNQTEIPTPKALMNIRGNSIGSSVKCGFFFQILQQELWKEAGIIAQEMDQHVELVLKNHSLSSPEDKIMIWVVNALSGFPTKFSYDDINFGDSNLWNRTFPKPTTSKGSFDEQTRRHYMQNLIFLFLVRNESYLLPPYFAAEIKPEEFALIFEQVRRENLTP